jgi:hypothetical protein
MPAGGVAHKGSCITVSYDPALAIEPGIAYAWSETVA